MPPPPLLQRFISRPTGAGLKRPGWVATWSSNLPPMFSSLPGAQQRCRALLLGVLAALALLLRPWPPFLWLPGWVVGGLLFWALLSLVICLCWPRRWR